MDYKVVSVARTANGVVALLKVEGVALPLSDAAKDIVAEDIQRRLDQAVLRPNTGDESPNVAARA